MAYTVSSDDPIWGGVDSDMENGTINIWFYLDASSVPTSDAPVEMLVHYRRFNTDSDAYSRDRIRYQMEFDAVNGMRLNFQVDKRGAGAISVYSSDMPLTTDGVVGWVMYSVTWDKASSDVSFYRNGALNKSNPNTVIPSLTPASTDTFAYGILSGPYRSGLQGDAHAAHLAVWKAAETAANLLSLYTSMTNNTAVSVSVFKGGSGITALFENPTPYTAYVTQFDIQGKRLKLYQPSTYAKANLDSAKKIGERVMTHDMAYQDDPFVGKDAGDFLISVLPAAQPRIETIEIDGARNAYLQTMAISVEPGDRISVTDTHSQISQDFWVNGVSKEIWGPGFIKATCYLARTYDVPFWLLGTVGFSELGQTTFVSY